MSMLYCEFRSRPIIPIELSTDQRQSLQDLARRPTSPQRTALRARIVLSCAEGVSQEVVARQQGVRR